MPAPESPCRYQELTLVEEFALLALDDETGKPLDLPPDALGYGLAGAIILDLSLAGRVDTDLQQLRVINATPTNDILLDVWLNHLRANPDPKSVMFWLRELASRCEEIQGAALDRLIQRGILRREERRLLWVFGVRRYPTIDGTERAEVRTRLTRLILGNDLPEPRDAILLSLIHGCRLSEHLFSGFNLKARRKRLEILAKTDLVGREVSVATIASLDVISRAFAETPMSF